MPSILKSVRGFKAQLVLLFVAFIAVMCTLSAWGAWIASDMQKATHEVFVAKDVVADILPPPLYLIEARLVVSQAAEGTLLPADAKARLEELETDFNARSNFWKDEGAHGLETHLLGAEYSKGLEFWSLVDKEILPAMAAGNQEMLNDTLPKLHKVYQEHREAVDATVVVANKFAIDTTTQLNKKLETSKLLLAAALLVTFLCAGALTYWIGKNLWGAVGAEPTDLSKEAYLMAHGDLTTPISTSVKGSLAFALEAMRTDLKGLIQKATLAATVVADASGEITQGITELASRTERQAAALTQATAATLQIKEGAAASMEDVTKALNAAQEVLRGARQAEVMAASASGSVETAVEKAQRIDEIVEVVKNLAAQTNLLALNAAIEAARAGEAGKGFAVVAQEVRRLSQATDGAAQSISELAHETGDTLATAKRYAQSSGTEVKNLTEELERLSYNVTTLDETSKRTLTLLEESTLALKDLELTTKQNTALVEESAATATVMNGQAQNLSAAVAPFKT